MIRLLIALAAGAGLTAVCFSIMTGSERLVWVWITAIVLVTGGIPLVVVARALGPQMGATSAQIEAARSAGRGGFARIDSVRRTGLLINDVPQYDLELSVAPTDRAAYRTAARELIDPMAAADFAPGTVREVVRVHEDDPRVALLPRASSSGAARHPIPPAEQLEVWKVSGRRPGGPFIGTGSEGRGLRWAAYLAVAAVGAAAVVVATKEEFALRLESLFSGEDRASLFADGRAGDAMAALEREAGNADAFEVVLYSGFATVDLATHAGADTVDSWTWRGGFVDHEGPATVQPSDPRAERFSLDDVDWSAMPRLLEESLRQTELRREDLSGEPYAFVDRTGNAGSIVIRVYLSTPYDSVNVSFTADGVLISD